MGGGESQETASHKPSSQRQFRKTSSATVGRPAGQPLAKAAAGTVRIAPPKNGWLSGWWGVGTGEQHSRIPSSRHVTSRPVAPTNKPLLPVPKICPGILLGARKTKRHYTDITTVTKRGANHSESEN